MSVQNCLPVHHLKTNIINNLHFFQQRSLERTMDWVIRREIVVVRSGGFSEIVVARSGGFSDIVVARSGGFRADW